MLYVLDNGCGIDERYHEKVFGLFERLDAADEGTGVGLAVEAGERFRRRARPLPPARRRRP